MRSDYCGTVNIQSAQKKVSLVGWVHRRRDHGGIIFLDVRDRTGIIQVVFNPGNAKAYNLADQIRNEYVIRAQGLVRMRPEGTVNPNMATGEIEVLGEELEVLNASITPPFPLDVYSEVGEDVRLKYRYIDLRRPEMQKKFHLRSHITHCLRNYLEGAAFLEMETPILTRATPEGARDYLVPSRTHAGRFFALPQSPQLFKQLLMMSGFDRYYQVARCFRDEDLRADRQPEFTQIDMEMSFMEKGEILQLAEGMIGHLFKEILGIDLGVFPVMSYAEAMSRFGSDKPDLRIPLELININDLMVKTEFKVFQGPAKDPKGSVAVLKVPGGASFTRKQIDDYTHLVGIYGASGLAWIKVNNCADLEAGLQSPILKFIPDTVLAELLERSEVCDGDILFFGAGKEAIVHESLGALRVQLGQDLNLYRDTWAPLWVVDFPMFEDNGQGGWTALHHPFTAPQCKMPKELLKKPGNVLSCAYDMVLNGVELGGGSLRIHDADMQQAVFSLLGIDEAKQKEKFGFLLEALQYGAPPHGGIAFGLDRLVMLMAGAESIREVIAFPKTQSAACPLTAAPSQVSASQLKELGLRVRNSATSTKDASS